MRRARLQIQSLKQGSNECKRTHSNYYKHKRTACSFRTGQHDIRSIHSTNQPTKINAESSSPLIVVYLDSEISHEEGEVTTSSTHSQSQQLMQTYGLFVSGGPTRYPFHTFNKPANEDQRGVVIAIDCSVFGQ